MAWIRALLLVAALVALAGCGSGASAKVVDPLASEGSLEAGGWPIGNSDPKGVQVRFVEASLFGIGIVLHNTSRTPVAVVSATVVEPPQSIAHQVGTTLLSWNPPHCPAHVVGCLVRRFFRQPSVSARPRPVLVRPEKGLAVQLDFRLGRCSEVPLASFAAVEQVDVAYRAGDSVQQQTIDLGGAALRLQRPPSTVCRTRPFSRLSLDGPFAGSTASAIPSSSYQLCARTPIGSFLCEDADRCARAGADVTFRSGLFEAGDRPASRIEIRLRGYRGTGRYLVGRDAEVTTVVGIGEHNWTTYRAFTGSVTVDRLTAGTLEGRVQATLTGFRKQPFRAFGKWACTVGA